MKHKIFFLLLILFSILLYNCSDPVSGFSDREKNMYRSAAYNYLSEEEKNSITGDWHEASVIRGVFKQCEYGGPGILLEGSTDILPYMTPMSSLMPEGTHLVAVTFNTSYDALLGPIVIIMSEDGMIIGTFLRL